MIYTPRGPKRHNHQMVSKSTASRGRSHDRNKSGLQEGRLERYSPSLGQVEGGVDRLPCCHERCGFWPKVTGKAEPHGTLSGRQKDPNSAGQRASHPSWMKWETLRASHKRTWELGKLIQC